MRPTPLGLVLAMTALNMLAQGAALGQCVPFEPIEISGAPSTAGVRLGTSLAIDADAAALGSASGAWMLTLDQAGVWSASPVPRSKGAADDDLFGVGVALDRSTLVVGASHDDSYAPDAGAVYVYDITDGVPVLEQQLGSPTPATRDWFGRSVAIDQGTLVVASPGDDDAANDAGAVSVFTKHNGFWLLQQTLTPPEPSPMDAFGTSIAIIGETLFVGAPGQDAAAPNAGAVYVYERADAVWTLTQRLLAPDGTIFDAFGQSVACDGRRLAIGAWAEDEGAPNAGAVYVYRRDTDAWIFEQKLTSATSSPSDMLGASVAIEDDLLIVGSVQADAHTPDTGAGVLFRDDGSGWIEVASIPGATSGAYAGAAVALSGSVALVGSPFDPSVGPDAGAVVSFDLRSPRCPGDLDLDCDTDVDDAITFLDDFNAQSPWSDLAPPAGVYDFCDVIAFIERFTLGCP